MSRQCGRRSTRRRAASKTSTSSTGCVCRTALSGDRVQLQQVIINLAINGIQAMATVDDRARELAISSEANTTGQVIVSVKDSGTGSCLTAPADCSTRSSPPSPAAWGWDWRSAAPSSKHMAAGCGRTARTERLVRCSGSAFRRCSQKTRRRQSGTLKRDRFPAALAGCRRPVRADRSRRRRRCLAAGSAQEPASICRVARRGLRLGRRLPGERSAPRCGLPDTRCAVAWPERPRPPGRANPGGNSDPVVFITGHAEVPMSVRAMKAGAIDLLTKPFHDQDLLDAVTAALDRDRKRRREEEKTSGLQASFESLTPRERLIMSCVTEGRMNKQIAHEIGVSGITVKIHRGNVMRKMAAKSLAELVAALGNQLPERRFVTIVGPGGIGKTTVALAAATTFRGRYRHGVWFVDLAPVAEGSRVPSALAARSAYCDKTGRSGCQSGLVPQRQGDAARHRQLRARRACGRPIMRGSVQQRSGRSYSRDQPRTAARLGRTGTALAGAAVPADLRTFESRGGDGFPGSRAMSCTKILSSRRSIFQHANG